MSDKAATWPLLSPVLRVWRRTAMPWQRRVHLPVAPVRPARAHGWRVHIHQSIHELDQQQWDALGGPQAVLRSHAYLSAIEDAGIDGCRYYYPVIYGHDQRVLAQACVYAVTTDFAQLLPRSCVRVVDVLRRLWPRLFSARVVECATPLFAGSSLSLASGADRAAVVDALEQAMVEIAARERCHLLVVRDFFADEREDLGFLLTRGYKCVSNLPLARIRVRWESYDDYLGSMRARYRKDIKRRLRRAAASGRTVEVLPDFGAGSAAWARQLAAIYASTGSFKRENVNAAYYANMNRALGADSVLLAVRHDGALIAHGMVIFDRQNTIATFFGREAGPAGGEWFLLMNEVIRLGIERGSQWISLGLGSYDAKVIVGAEIEPLYVYTRSTQPMINALIKLVPDLMRQRPARQRRLFRTPERAADEAPAQ